MRIDMVHAASIPAGAIRGQDRALLYFAFVVPRRGQLRDFEGAKAGAVAGITVLRISNDRIPEHQDSAAGSRNMRIGLNDGALGMLEPRPPQIVGIIKSKRVVLLIRIGLDK